MLYSHLSAKDTVFAALPTHCSRLGIDSLVLAMLMAKLGCEIGRMSCGEGRTVFPYVVMLNPHEDDLGLRGILYVYLPRMMAGFEFLATDMKQRKCGRMSKIKILENTGSSK